MFCFRQRFQYSFFEGLDKLTCTKNYNTKESQAENTPLHKTSLNKTLVDLEINISSYKNAVLFIVTFKQFFL